MTVHIAPSAITGNDAALFRDSVLPVLRTKLGAQNFDSWMRRIELARVEGDVALLTLPTKFLASWVREKYSDVIVAEIRGAFPFVRRAVFSVRSAAGRPAATPAPQIVAPQPAAVVTAPASPVPTAPDVVAASPLDPALTFETFLVNETNRLAFTEARRLADLAPGAPPVFAPLFLYGGVGLGKMHLAQAIAHVAGPRGLYLSAEAFMYRFVASLRDPSRQDFEDRLRRFDVLIIDDAHFLHGTSVVAAFSRAVTAVLAARRGLVVVADRPPVELDRLDTRMRSILACGLTVEIKPPDRGLRADIVRARVAAAQARLPGFDLSDDVVAFIAESVEASARDLAGAVNRLLATASLSAQPITVESATVAIRDLIQAREPRRVRIEEIQKLVATHYNVSRADILSSRRTANVVRPRQIAMYLSKVLTLRSLTEIGRRFGGRDHTTALHAIRRIEEFMRDDQAFAAEMNAIRSMLEDAA